MLTYSILIPRMTEGASTITSEQISNQQYLIEVWDLTSLDKDSLTRDMVDISNIDQEVFGIEHGLDVPNTIEFFKSNPDLTTVVIRDSHSEPNNIVGFVIAEAWETVIEDGKFVERRPSTTTAFITKTAITKECRGKQLFPLLIHTLELTLKDKGFEFIEADVAAYSLGGKESLAVQMVKTNSERIVEKYPHDSPLGPQMFIRMRL